MSKTKTVYLLVEREVEDTNILGSPEERAIEVLDHALFSKCVGVKGKGYRSELLGTMIIQKPVVLSDYIKEIIWQESMSQLPLHKRLAAAVIEDGKRPAIERWQELIDRGVINHKGEVLLRGPWDEGDGDE